MAFTPLPWTSNYEEGGSLDDATSMPTLTDNVNVQSADSVNSLAESLIEVETHLGLPDGGSDITTRVGDLETAPPTHASTHQNGGGDEISVAGLSGTLADPQTPTTHATSHQSGGGDTIKLDDLAAPDDNTDLNASVSAHGLLPKLSGNSGEALRGDGSWATVASASGLSLDDTYTDAYYSGAAVKWNNSLQQGVLGFRDTFSGAALGAAWTSTTGDDGTITVASDSLTITDGSTGTNYPKIYRAIPQSLCYEWQCHITMNSTVNNSSMVVGAYSGSNVLADRYVITQMQRSGGGTQIWTYGSFGLIGNTNGGDAWFRIICSPYGYQMLASNNAYSLPPGNDQWTRVTSGVHVNIIMPAYFFVFVVNSGVGTASFTLRSLQFRYL